MSEFKRIMLCQSHGSRFWLGHIVCATCGLIYQTSDEDKPRHAPRVCSCQSQLMPPTRQPHGDVLGTAGSGVAVMSDGTLVQGSEYPDDWSARPICYLCFRY